jgi:MOSC domain-containing protein YiiM
MKLLSINVGGPRDIDWRGNVVRTSIFKSPVAGQVRVMTLNLEGDQQSDLSVHGGIDLYATDARNQDLLRRASELAALPEGWREYFRRRLWEPDA